MIGLTAMATTDTTEALAPPVGGGTRESDRLIEARLDLEGMHCASCVQSIEAALAVVANALRLRGFRRAA